jgi:hypothetical protein
MIRKQDRIDRVIYHSREAAWLAVLLLSPPFAACLVQLVQLDSSKHQLLLIGATIGTLLFGFGLILYGRRLLFRIKALTLTQEALVSHRVGRQLRWQDIKHAKSLPNSWQPDISSGKLELLVNQQGNETLMYLDVSGLEEEPEAIAELINTIVQSVSPSVPEKSPDMSS